MTKKIQKLDGIYPPVPTSFDSDENLSPGSISENIKYLNRFDLQGYVILGSNGEYVMLNAREKIEVFETARKVIPSKKLMIAGTGCQSTAETISLNKKAAETGADLVLVITPNYYRSRMDDEAITKHYFLVADFSPVPVLVYNMPANTGIDLDAETIIKLSRHPNIYGIKDSGGNIIKMAEVIRLADPGFQVLAGSAGFLLPALSVGAVGGIMALANLTPDICISIYDNYLAGDMKKARELQLKIISLNNAITRRWGVAALKAALDMAGLYGGKVRMPLLPVNNDIKEKLRVLMTEVGIL